NFGHRHERGGEGHKVSSAARAAAECRELMAFERGERTPLMPPSNRGLRPPSGFFLAIDCHQFQSVPTARGARWQRRSNNGHFHSGGARIAQICVGLSRPAPPMEPAMPAAARTRQPADFPQTGEDARRAIRNGQWTGPTSGMAPGYVQGNLAILPASLASDFLRFCQLNPKPCPLLAAGSPGDPRLPSLGHDLDIRTDLCRYKVYRNGELVDEPDDLTGHWRDDLVTFALGCSFSFEDALVQDGIELRHITNGSTVPMYRTNVETAPAGPFHGPLVVSM